MGKLSKIAFVFQLIGLTYLAAYLRSKNIDVKIFDSQIETAPIQSIVRDYNPDVIGINRVTFLVPSTIELSRYLRMTDAKAFRDITFGVFQFIRASLLPDR